MLTSSGCRDATTPAGKLQLHILGAIAEFERARIAERVKAGLARVRASGRRLGRPMAPVSEADVARAAHLSIREAAATVGVSRSVIQRARAARLRTSVGESVLSQPRRSAPAFLHSVEASRDDEVDEAVDNRRPTP